MQNKEKLIIFDCDGTLIDSQFSIISAFEESFEMVNLNKPSKNNIRNIIGLSLIKATEKLLMSIGLSDFDDVNKYTKVIVNNYVKIVSSKKNEVKEITYPYVNEMLEELQKNNFLLAVVTGKSKNALKRVLNENKLNNFFHCLKTSCDGVCKPNPDVLYDVMDELSVSKNNIVMVGDTTFDIEMAFNANVKSIGVSFGYHNVEKLKLSGAEFIIDDYKKFASKINTLF